MEPRCDFCGNHDKFRCRSPADAIACNGIRDSIISDLDGPVVSDGGSTSYYELPAHATELRHLISHKGMSKARGDIFKACYRLGEKAGTDIDYDLEKMEFFIKDLKEMRARGEHL